MYFINVYKKADFLELKRAFQPDRFRSVDSFVLLGCCVFALCCVVFCCMMCSCVFVCVVCTSSCEQLCALWLRVCGSNVKITSWHRYPQTPAAHSLDAAEHCTTATLNTSTLQFIDGHKTSGYALHRRELDSVK